MYRKEPTVVDSDVVSERSESSCSNVAVSEASQKDVDVVYERRRGSNQAVPVGSQKGRKEEPPAFKVIEDEFKTFGEVRKRIKQVVDVDVGLIFGIDFTLSNKIQGQKTFGGKSLHTVAEGEVNPYEEVICILGETLETLDDDGIIPAYGFGDSRVKDHGIFPLKGGTNGECEGFLEVLDEYQKVAKTVRLGGPTNFAPLIDEAIDIVKKKKQFHVLVIVADGQVVNEDDTVKAIVEASNYPLSIVVIGVGDGPWDVMVEFDDQLPERNFDNFQFVDFHAIKSTARNPETAIALAALMEVPEQFEEMRKLGLLRNLLN